MLLVIAAAALFAVGARAQDQAPATTPAAAPATTPATKQTKEQKKAAWEAGVKADCSAEIADGGICAGKDFTTGLEKCLHENRAKLSDACKATVHRHHKGAKTGGAAPGTTPAMTPATTPATTTTP
jgi:hypothetical protein